MHTNITLIGVLRLRIDYLHPVIFQKHIAGEQRDALHQGLGCQHAVEWVAVQEGKGWQIGVDIVSCRGYNVPT